MIVVPVATGHDARMRVCAHGDKQASPGCFVVEKQQHMLLPVMYAAHHGDSTQLLVCMYAYTATGKGTQLRRRGGAAAHAARYARYIRSTSWRLRVCRIWRSTAGHKMCQSMYRTCQLLYMICKMRVYICACIDACVCTDACASVCVYVCICVLKCLRAECRRLYVGISLSPRGILQWIPRPWDPFLRSKSSPWQSQGVVLTRPP